MEQTTMPNIRPFNMIALKKRAPNPRLAIETLLMNQRIFEAVKPFFINGGICGHKVMDVKGAVDILRGSDKDGTLEDFKLNDFKLGNSLKNVLRSRYELDKKWKIQGENDKKVLGPKVDEAA